MYPQDDALVDGAEEELGPHVDLLPRPVLHPGHRGRDSGRGQSSEVHEAAELLGSKSGFVEVERMPGNNKTF